MENSGESYTAPIDDDKCSNYTCVVEHEDWPTDDWAYSKAESEPLTTDNQPVTCTDVRIDIRGDELVCSAKGVGCVRK